MADAKFRVPILSDEKMLYGLHMWDGRKRHSAIFFQYREKSESACHVMMA